MLSAHELARLCERLGLSAEAKAVIETIRASPPSRRVRSAAGNVSVRYPSRKMRAIIQAESHRVELAGVYEYEHDQQTLEFYDQPPAIKLVYQARSARHVGVWHTPDYFVIRSDAIGWEEWKTEVELERLAEMMPHRYGRDEVGRWRCPPGERFAEPFGLFYRLRSSAEIDWVFQRNLRFLEDYLGSEVSPLSEHIAEAILALVGRQPGMHLDELVGDLGEASADDVYALIASNCLYVDLHGAPLAEPERVRLFRNEEIARAYALVGNSASAARGLGAEAQEQLTGASPADLQEANRRHAILTPHLAGMAAVPGALASCRTHPRLRVHRPAPALEPAR